MTPNDIVKDLLLYGMREYQHGTLGNKKAQAIEAIKQYAREMCIEQKQNCLYSFETNVPHEFTAHDAIMRANFPKELSK